MDWDFISEEGGLGAEPLPLELLRALGLAQIWLRIDWGILGAVLLAEGAAGSPGALSWIWVVACCWSPLLRTYARNFRENRLKDSQTRPEGIDFRTSTGGRCMRVELGMGTAGRGRANTDGGSSSSLGFNFGALKSSWLNWVGTIFWDSVVFIDAKGWVYMDITSFALQIIIPVNKRTSLTIQYLNLNQQSAYLLRIRH